MQNSKRFKIVSSFSLKNKNISRWKPLTVGFHLGGSWGKNSFLNECVNHGFSNQ